MDLRDDYALVTVYVRCQTLYDQLFLKQKPWMSRKTENNREAYKLQEVGNCGRAHTACKWLYNESFKLQTQVQQL